MFKQAGGAGVDDPTVPGFRWDGTVSAGNVLTTLSMAVALIVWGARLEARVDAEAVLRQHFETTTTQAIRDLKADQSTAMAEIESRLNDEAATRRSDDAEVKASLRNIDDRLTAVLLALTTPAGHVPMNGGHP